MKSRIDGNKQLVVHHRHFIKQTSKNAHNLQTVQMRIIEKFQISRRQYG